MSFIGDDPRWMTKVLIGGALMLVAGFVLPLPLLWGWRYRLAQRTIAGDPLPMPEWDDVGGLFQDGLKVCGLVLGHVLPVTFPPGLLFALLALLAASTQPRDGAGAVLGLMVLALYVLIGLVALALALYLPVAQARFAASGGDWKVGFDVRGHVRFIAANPANWIIAWLVGLVAHFAGQIGFLLCCVGVFATAFLADAIQAFAMAEAVRVDVAGAPRVSLSKR